ncbi:hypothetical protein EDD16DRAFT_1712618 [Pisolithus croceorrhizus]|nr:hypothetical protein EDD16DRAFT_1712618 [Pisolithus croceorrhizus]KAI6134398.1 hypothetical protein EV401DRAFT_2168097 [Pisolithus croceorrhizus]KAI6167844.1 hypothetical protein EDD17DRAFT_1836606 [Pisolithus thermaeus]
MSIINDLMLSCAGSFIEEPAMSIVWCFWTGPPDSTITIDDDPTITTTTSDTSATMNAATSSPSSQSHYSDHSWARCQAGEAQNHIFNSLGEQYSLRIILCQSFFLVLPNSILHLTAVGMILHLSGGAGVGNPD